MYFGNTQTKGLDNTDTKLSREIEKLHDSEGSGHDRGWAESWQKCFNSEKCKVMHMGVRSIKTKYTLCGVEKDLGVLLDNNLKNSKQSGASANKGGKS